VKKIDNQTKVRNLTEKDWVAERISGVASKQESKRNSEGRE